MNIQSVCRITLTITLLLTCNFAHSMDDITQLRQALTQSGEIIKSLHLAITSERQLREQTLAHHDNKIDLMKKGAAMEENELCRIRLLLKERLMQAALEACIARQPFANWMKPAQPGCVREPLDYKSRKNSLRVDRQKLANYAWLEDSLTEEATENAPMDFAARSWQLAWENGPKRNKAQRKHDRIVAQEDADFAEECRWQEEQLAYERECKAYGASVALAKKHRWISTLPRQQQWKEYLALNGAALPPKAKKVRMGHNIMVTLQRQTKNSWCLALEHVTADQPFAHCMTPAKPGSLMA